MYVSKTWDGDGVSKWNGTEVRGRGGGMGGRREEISRWGGSARMDANNMKLIHTQYSAQFYITKRKVKKCQKKCAF